MDTVMEEDVYDSDDARAFTPPLKRSRVDLRPYKTPTPPFVPEKSESPKGKESPSGRVRKDRPDLAHQLTQAHVQSVSPSDTSESNDRAELKGINRHTEDSMQHADSACRSPCEVQNPPSLEEKPPPSVQQRKPQDPCNVMNICNQWMDPSESVPIKKEQAFSDHDRIPFRTRMHSQEPAFKYQLPRINSNPEDREVASRSSRVKEELELPHPDQKRVCRSHHPSPSLPVLQSPPQSTASPDSARNLPPIKALVGPSFEEPARFPAFSTFEPQYLPASFRRAATFSHLTAASTKDMSSLSPTPVAGTPHSSYWAPSTNAECSQSQSPGDTSSHFTGSPATGYPTPIEPRKDETKTSTPQNSGGFKCEHPGCNSEPFQTQYLLNSHANVHSENRPYHCPVEDCPRGKGGTGFKRKNEMKRHALVHNSPGYICPFCSDQQRQYPRPDNLQRHVRAQHGDKDKNDPLLRQVLAKRSEGVARGRRRRA
ncbi:conserved hypothetical protein [Coccidioides posadasii str. Silveira]|uniref:C2H2-type domain-containing protein n=2 Tax=Coccidioides posadasii TaxID=199306 RepID=E9DDR3_COCPS|nr:conserved hypothetical protein [Coccidioides posadasii str. Silveira]KMM70302.1 hypothetical protein CPAG_06614 [Coccidioides posadasii RMSCC 3488]